MSITISQIRGARGILNWSQKDLADRTGISNNTIGQIEKGSNFARETTLTAIRNAFEDAGIEFLANDGVRRRAGEVRVLSGKQGFADFFADVYATLSTSAEKNVYVSNVDERQFIKILDENVSEHVNRLKELKANYKILIEEGDDFVPAEVYAEYRWLPADYFSSVPFYLYGDKLGILLFEGEEKVIVIDHPGVAQAYKNQFMALWTNAKPTISKAAVNNG